MEGLRGNASITREWVTHPCCASGFVDVMKRWREGAPAKVVL